LTRTKARSIEDEVLDSKPLEYAADVFFACRLLRSELEEILSGFGGDRRRFRTRADLRERR
jgi:hypothetical protein